MASNYGSVGWGGDGPFASTCGSGGWSDDDFDAYTTSSWITRNGLGGGNNSSSNSPFHAEQDWRVVQPNNTCSDHDQRGGSFSPTASSTDYSEGWGGFTSEEATAAPQVNIPQNTFRRYCRHLDQAKTFSFPTSVRHTRLYCDDKARLPTPLYRECHFVIIIIEYPLSATFQTKMQPALSNISVRIEIRQIFPCADFRLSAPRRD